MGSGYVQLCLPLDLDGDTEDLEGFMLISPAAEQCHIASAVREAAALGWEGLDSLETGDELEELEDGTMKVIMVRRVVSGISRVN